MYDAKGAIIKGEEGWSFRFPYNKNSSQERAGDFWRALSHNPFCERWDLFHLFLPPSRLWLMVASSFIRQFAVLSLEIARLVESSSSAEDHMIKGIFIWSGNGGMLNKVGLNEPFGK